MRNTHESLSQPSKTMQAVCAVRVNNTNLLGEDRVAATILKKLPDASKYQAELDSASHGMFSRSIIIRTLFFSEAMKQSHDFQQLVILSFGMDFRFLNYADWQVKPVFLIDHSQSLDLTSQLSQDSLEGVTNIQKIAMDFRGIFADTFLKALLNQGFNPLLPTLFLWQGATFYLEPTVVFNMLNAVAKASKVNKLIVDFANFDSFRNPKMLETPDEGVKESFKLLKREGEPWLGFFKLNEVKEKLADFEYENVESYWDQDLERRYLDESQMPDKAMFYIEASKK